MKILVATDGTAHSTSVLDALNKISLTDHDTVKVVTVVDMAIPLAIDIYAGYLPESSELEKAAKQNADRVLAEAVHAIKESIEVPNIEVSSELLFGAPDRRIVETAEKMNADLIIVGSHGYNRWERLLLGSVSDSILHHSPCSVLVVRATN